MERIIQFKDRFAHLSDELSFLHEVAAGVLLEEIPLSKKGISGLATLLYSLVDEVESMDRCFQQYDKSDWDRFLELVQSNEVLTRYFQDDWSRMSMEKIWSEYDEMTDNEKFLVAFMIMVYNPPEHKFPPFQEFLAFGKFHKLTPLDQQIILEWASDPFWVCDASGNVTK